SIRTSTSSRWRRNNAETTRRRSRSSRATSRPNRLRSTRQRKAGRNAGLFACELERAVEHAAVDQQILSGDVAGLRRAQERRRRAEFIRFAEAPRRDGSDAGLGGFLEAHALLLGGLGERAAQAVGVERAGQDIVDGDIVGGHRA